MQSNFNYAVGYKNTSGRIACYAYGCQVFFGDIDDAEDFLEYVKRQVPCEQWEIYKLEEI